MKNAWTPGPWAVTKPNANGEVFVKDTRVPPQLITSAVQSDREHGATANAALISAAPALADALDGLLNALPSGTSRPAIQAAHAALAKARGEP